MGIYGSVLHNYIIRNDNSIRRKVPNGFDATLHHDIRHILCLVYRNGQYPNVDTGLLLKFSKFINMMDGYVIDGGPRQFCLTSNRLDFHAELL